MNLCVITSLGRLGEAEPRVFFVGTRRLIIADILDRWSDQAHRYFEVTCEDGRRFLLRHDASRNAWELAGVFATRVRQPRQPAAKPAAAPKRWWSALRRA